MHVLNFSPLFSLFLYLIFFQGAIPRLFAFFLEGFIFGTSCAEVAPYLCARLSESCNSDGAKVNNYICLMANSDTNNYVPYEYNTNSSDSSSSFLTVSEECKVQQAGDRAFLDYRDMYDSDKNGLVGMDDFRFTLQKSLGKCCGINCPLATNTGYDRKMVCKTRCVCHCVYRECLFHQKMRFPFTQYFILFSFFLKTFLLLLLIVNISLSLFFSC